MKTKLLLIGLPILALAVDDRAEIENAQVRVRSVTMSARARGNLDEYSLNRVIVFLDGGAEALTSTNGKQQKMSWKAGDVRWFRAGSYTTENVTEKPFRAVEVEIKSRPSGKRMIWPARDPVKNDSRDYSFEFENPQVRVLRVKSGPNNLTPLHEHVLNRVSVFLTDAYIKVAAADGTATESRFNAGTAAWGGPTTHTEQNLTDKPFQVVLVEIKP